jgi:hypothetical protein
MLPFGMQDPPSQADERLAEEGNPAPPTPDDENGRLFSPGLSPNQRRPPPEIEEDEEDYSDLPELIPRGRPPPLRPVVTTVDSDDEEDDEDVVGKMEDMGEKEDLAANVGPGTGHFDFTLCRIISKGKGKNQETVCGNPAHRCGRNRHQQLALDPSNVAEEGYFTLVQNPSPSSRLIEGRLDGLYATRRSEEEMRAIQEEDRATMAAVSANRLHQPDEPGFMKPRFSGGVTHPTVAANPKGEHPSKDDYQKKVRTGPVKNSTEGREHVSLKSPPPENSRTTGRGKPPTEKTNTTEPLSEEEDRWLEYLVASLGIHPPAKGHHPRSMTDYDEVVTHHLREGTLSTENFSQYIRWRTDYESPARATTTTSPHGEPQGSNTTPGTWDDESSPQAKVAGLERIIGTGVTVVSSLKNQLKQETAARERLENTVRNLQHHAPPPPSNPPARVSYEPQPGETFHENRPQASMGEPERGRERSRSRPPTPAKVKQQEGVNYAYNDPPPEVLETTRRWYAVVQGREHGVYNEGWDHKVQRLIDGYSGARFKRFGHYDKALDWFFENALEPAPTEPTTTTNQDDKGNRGNGKPEIPPTYHAAPAPTNQEYQDSQHHNASPPVASPPTRESATTPPFISRQAAAQDKFFGADRSTTSNEIHGVDITLEEEAIRMLAPPGTSHEVKQSLTNGMLDIPSLPGKHLKNTPREEIAFNELASVLHAGFMGNDLRKDGRIQEELNFRKPSSNQLDFIKSVSDLRSVRDDFHDMKDEVTRQSLSKWRRVLFHAGWDEESIQAWVIGGVLPRIMATSIENYYALIMEAERLCEHGQWTDQVQTFIEHHAKKLKSIRVYESASRLHMVLLSYTYLRDSRKAKFTCEELGRKQTDLLRTRLTELQSQLEGTESSPTNRDRNRNRNGAGGNDDASIRCGRCKSNTLHPQLNSSRCIFRGYSNSVARRMARLAERKIQSGVGKQKAINDAEREINANPAAEEPAADVPE